MHDLSIIVTLAGGLAVTLIFRGAGVPGGRGRGMHSDEVM